VTAPEYAGTGVHHMLYLPPDWQADWKTRGRSWPVIVEYTGNKAPTLGSTGLVEDAALGFGVSGGRFIWVVLPYVSKTHVQNEVTWWGDEEATAAYAKTNVPRICAQFGGDTRAVIRAVRSADGEWGLSHTVLTHGQDACKVLRRSADEGRTWSEPRKIRDASHAYTTGPHDRLYTLSSGRLLALLHCSLDSKKDRQGGPLGVYVVYSDDHGRTWNRAPRNRVLHVADNPSKKHEWGFWEPSLVEHAPGKLLMMARTATGWLYECRSEDGGSTWTNPARSTVPNPLAPPVLTQVPGTGTLVLLHNPRVQMESGWHGGPRTVLALRTSQDGGRSWNDPRTIVQSADESAWCDYPAVRWVGRTLRVVYRAIATLAHGNGGFRTVGLEHQALDRAWIR